MNTIRARLFVGVCALAAVMVAYAANVAGTWTLSVESPRGTRESTLVLAQKGEEVTGTMKTQRGEMPVTGTLKGNAIAFGYKASMQGNEMEIQYSGTVDGDSMSGTVSFGGMGEGKFTGKKQP
jgi:D-glucosaminate-6-phosphate ammonia-lyase